MKIEIDISNGMYREMPTKEEQTLEGREFNNLQAQILTSLCSCIMRKIIDVGKTPEQRSHLLEYTKDLLTDLLDVYEHRDEEEKKS